MTKTMCGADCLTDHRLVVSKLTLRIQPAMRPQGKKAPERLDVSKPRLMKPVLLCFLQEILLSMILFFMLIFCIFSVILTMSSLIASCLDYVIFVFGEQFWSRSWGIGTAASLDWLVGIYASHRLRKLHFFHEKVS